jgi:2-polyprenyl-6-methoxyphenol hydroxylase-like FAD-dependent oxidoreductase
VIIVGGGPCGLTLANELGRRGISAVLVDQRPGTALNPQANATQARTMEHFRRLGFSREIRALGMPADYPTDIAYFTRFMGYELARFHLPSAREAEQKIKSMSGSWSAAELPHRVSQKFVESVLRRHAEQWLDISVHYNWQLSNIREHEGHVEADIRNVVDGTTETVQGDYLIGADGARSMVRGHLGISYQGETGVIRNFMGGRMHAIYLRSRSFYTDSPHRPAWMHVTFNRDRRAFMTAIDGVSEFAFHTQLNSDEDEKEVSDSDARAMFHAAVGSPVDFEILSRGSWTAGHTLVAERFRRSRIFLAGDAAHLFTPTGGLGYNTAVEDAVNLAWKLAAVINGQAGAKLLDSYETERLGIAQRNTRYAREFADSLGRLSPVAEIEDDSAQGIDARRIAGEYFLNHARVEFNIPGITFGGRYDGSPAIISDGTSPPPDAPNEYHPTACPGGRPPHFWLSESRSLFDTFGMDWTLLRLGPHAPEGLAFIRAAEEIGLSLSIVDVPTSATRDLYEADLALIRPDQIVGWRGANDKAASQIFAEICARA